MQTELLDDAPVVSSAEWEDICSGKHGQAVTARDIHYDGDYLGYGIIDITLTRCHIYIDNVLCEVSGFPVQHYKGPGKEFRTAVTKALRKSCGPHGTYITNVFNFRALNYDVPYPNKWKYNRRRY